MPSVFRTPKNLADWLRLDYFRYPRRLPRLWRAVCWATLVLSVGVLCAAAFHKSEPTLYQAGPLSTGHASFNQDCGQCHQDRFATAQRFLPWNQSVSSVPDSACKKCHDGPIHSDKLLTTTQSCASCHQEHRGLKTLARLPDATCLKCHRDLKANSKSGRQCVIQDVSGFPYGHPEFRGLGTTDPGHIRFNHWAHINLDVDGFSLESSQHTKGKPALACADCHAIDAAGRYMQPIQYLTHCQRCHPLSVQLGGTFAGDRLRAAAKAFAKEPAPHTAPNIVRAVLRDRLLKFTNDHPLQASVEAADGEGIIGPKPNLETDLTKVRWVSYSNKMPDTDQRAFVDRQLALSEQLCFDRGGGCQLCHEPTKPRALDGSLPEYKCSDIPNRWFPKSRFDHYAHRMMKCTDCHAVNEQSVQSSDVMMPKLTNSEQGVKSCAECHNPSVGARSDCIACHIYHPRHYGLEGPRLCPNEESLGK